MSARAACRVFIVSIVSCVSWRASRVFVAVVFWWCFCLIILKQICLRLLIRALFYDNVVVVSCCRFLLFFDLHVDLQAKHPGAGTQFWIDSCISCSAIRARRTRILEMPCGCLDWCVLSSFWVRCCGVGWGVLQGKEGAPKSFCRLLAPCLRSLFLIA